LFSEIFTGSFRTTDS